MVYIFRVLIGWLVILGLTACGTSEVQAPLPTTAVPALRIVAQPTQAATIFLTPTHTLVPTAVLTATRTRAPATITPIRIIITATETPTKTATLTLPVYTVALTGITEHTHEIFRRGQQNGKRANVFSKVGDSLTVATYVLYPIGWGAYNLRDYYGLLPAVQFFSSAEVREGTGNSFANISLSADNGWTTQSVLNPQLANAQFCRPGETPLLCEYRLVRPSVALILLGTNDVSELPAATFEGNMRRIIELSIEQGIIPVVSTIPNRIEYEQQVAEFNAIIRRLAYQFGVPLWEYGLAMAYLPDGGLSTDGVHPSWPPGDFPEAADFTAYNLRYGYTLRNLTTIQVLDTLWREVIAPPE
jgi:hypothetical protein